MVLETLPESQSLFIGTDAIDQDLLDMFGLTTEDLTQLPELSSYLILDGHRTGIEDHDDNPARGYLEGAKFALRFSIILRQMGGKQASFLIHTLRNYKTMDRMRAIFKAVGDIGEKFIRQAIDEDIHLRYYGEQVHSTYALADIINKAEYATSHCSGFELNFLTNYSDDWAIENMDQILDLPEMTVIGRFTKGHYSGASIPGHSPAANFIYIQQASISENWSDRDIICLILSLLKSHLALQGFVGGKTYRHTERELIRRRREEDLYTEEYCLSSTPTKRLISFSPYGPLSIMF